MVASHFEMYISRSPLAALMSVCGSLYLFLLQQSDFEALKINGSSEMGMDD